MVAPTVPLPAMVVLLVAVSAMALVSGASMRGRHGQGQQQGQLRMGFYSSSCPAAEKIIGDYVRLHVRRAPTVAPALLRLHYHDCFVSVHITTHYFDSTPLPCEFDHSIYGHCLSVLLCSCRAATGPSC